MSEISRLTLEIDSNGVVKANGNLDLFKKKSDDAAKAASGVESANKKTAKSFGLVNQLTDMHTLAMGAANIGIIKFMDSCAEASGRMEMLRTNLQVVTGSAQEADTMFRQLQRFAAETPFSVEGITDTATQLMQVGVAADDVMSQLQMLGDVSGGSQEKLNRIMTNYTQILSVGKASTMDIRQFAQANLPIYQELEKVTGKTGEALQDMITNGKITGEVITKAFQDMTAEGGKFYNGMSLASETYEGKLSTMKDSVTNLSAAFSDLWYTDFKKSAFDAIAAVSDELANFFRENKEHADAFKIFNTDYTNSSFNQREYVANEQIEYWSKRSQMLKRVGGDYKSDPEYQEAIKQLNGWYDYLDKITRQEAKLTKEQREMEEAAKSASETGKNAAKEAEKWQEVLKKALSLEEVSTGAQAVADYQRNLEDSLHGAIAYAQMMGESVKDVYTEYAKKIRIALSEVLSSGQFNVLDNAVTSLSNLEKSYSVSFGISNQSLFDDNLFSSSGKPSDSLKQSYIQMITEAQAEAAKNGDWSGYAKNSAIVSGYQSIQGTDAGNFAQGMSQGGWQQGLINMVLGAFMKNLEDVEGFQRALNLVTEALAPAADMIGEVFTALEPLMDAAVIGGEIGQQLANVTLGIKTLMPTIRMLAAFILGISKVLGMAMSAIENAFDWLFGDITDGMNDFSDAMIGSTEAAEEQADATSNLIDELKALREQLREDQLYYASQNTSLNAAQNISSVNDAIIAPGGHIISTAPDDYLIATKTPGSLGSGGNRVTITVVNNAGDVAEAEAVSTERADGMTEILVMVDKRVANGIAAGAFDTALLARERRMAGRRISV